MEKRGPGRPPVPLELSKLRKLTNDELIDIGSMIVKGTTADLKKIDSDPESPVLTKWIARAALKGIMEGDIHILNQLLNRLVGKVKEQVEITLPKPTVIKRMDGSEVILGTQEHREKLVQ